VQLKPLKSGGQGRNRTADVSLFRAGLCCSLNNLCDSRWPPKSLRSRDRQEHHGWDSRVQMQTQAKLPFQQKLLAFSSGQLPQCLAFSAARANSAPTATAPDSGDCRNCSRLWEFSHLPGACCTYAEKLSARALLVFRAACMGRMGDVDATYVSAYRLPIWGPPSIGR